MYQSAGERQAESLADYVKADDLVVLHDPQLLPAVPGLAAGPALSAHPRLERITFTGATVTGQRVLQSAAENLTYATMELGGKNAVLVLADADLDAAVHVAVEGMFYNQGEACTSTARILVQADIHDEFLARFARATEALVVGDGLDAATDIGPMVEAAQRDKVLAYLRTGLDEGARLVTQGTLPAQKRLRDAYWVAPTILADVTPDMTVAREEIFGPIACVMRFRAEDDAIEIANGTAYGLTAAICTTDLVRADQIARRLEAGGPAGRHAEDRQPLAAARRAGRAGEPVRRPERRPHRGRPLVGTRRVA